MLKLLKKLAKQKIEADEIPFAVIGTWFEAKMRETSLPQEVSAIFNDMDELVTDLKLSTRNIVSMKPEGIPETVEQHKKEYLSKLNLFINQITTDKRDIDSILNYGEQLSVALDQFDESTKLNVSIMKKFFAEDMNEIDFAFDAIKETLEELRVLVKKELGVMFVYDVKKKIAEIKKKRKEVIDLREAIQKERNKKKESEEYLMFLETDMDNLKSNSQYQKYDQLLSNKIRFEKEIERENEAIRPLLSPLLKILEQYDKKELGADRVLARNYAQNPIETLHNDHNLWILNLLQTIASKLPEIEEDEAKRMKMRQSLMAVTEVALKNHLSRYETLKSAMNQVQRQIVMDNTTMKIEDIKYKLSHVSKQLNISDENTQKSEESIKALNIEKDLLMLEKKLSLLGSVKLI